MANTSGSSESVSISLSKRSCIKTSCYLRGKELSETPFSCLEARDNRGFEVTCSARYKILLRLT